MGLRRRIALFLDPSLDIEPEPIYSAAGERLYTATQWAAYDSANRHWRLAREVTRLAEAVSEIERRAHPSKGRNIWCEHPELHPEVELVS